MNVGVKKQNELITCAGIDESAIHLMWSPMYCLKLRQQQQQQKDEQIYAILNEVKNETHLSHFIYQSEGNAGNCYCYEYVIESVCNDTIHCIRSNVALWCRCCVHSIQLIDRMENSMKTFTWT